MNSQEYLDAVKRCYSEATSIKECTSEQLLTYEEVFKWGWIATKLKIFSFVKFLENVDLTTIEQYSTHCLKRAIKEKSGLPRGFQNGVLSYNVLLCNCVSEDAIAFATARPNKHAAAFEYPIIYDLSNHKLYYYSGEIIWGKVYNRFMNAYLVEHFSVQQKHPLLTLF